MIRYVFIISLCVSLSVTMLGQSQTITGVVLDGESKTPIPGVIIQLFDANDKLIAYTSSKNNGTFSLPYSDKSAILSFKCMNYRNHTIPVSENISPLEILMVEEPTRLRDVVVRAPAIVMRSDTLVYNVQRFADAQDRTIADVLKKMPGIEITGSGQIKYNGEPINKFYIEGSDLLEGRYGLATNNISHKDVQNVEVIENHQPIRALQGVEYSEQAALNLRLKEDAKLRWCGVINGGVGFSPALYDASLFAMRIAGKVQSMETIRINNTGWNPASQSTRYTSDNLFGTTLYSQLPNYISVGKYATPLEEQRTRFNQSFLVHTTNSIKLNKDYEVKANLTYERDKLKVERFSHTNYFNDTIAPFRETESLHTDAHAVSGQIILQANKPSTYFKNNFSVDLGWNNAVSNITGLSLINQRAETPAFNIANELQIAKRIRNQILTISSSNGIANKPHYLLAENEGQRYVQDIASSAFQSVTELSYGWILGRWKIRGRAGFNYSHNELNSDLTGINLNVFSTINNSCLNRMNIYVRPNVSYENKRILLNLHASINQYRYAFNDRQMGENKSKAYTTIFPTLYLRYKFSARLALSTNIRYTLTPPSPNTYYSGIIMNNYRYLSLGYPQYDLDIQYAANLSLQYRDPIASFFANMGALYERNNFSLAYNQMFLNDQIMMTYRPLSNSSDFFRINGSLSKGIFFGKIHIGIEAGYTQVTSATMRNSMVVPYQLSAISIMPKMKGTIAKWVAMEYSLLAGRSTMNFTDSSSVSTYDNLKQKLNISLFPIKKLQIYISGEHYFIKFNDNTSDNLLLLDTGVKWMVSDKVNISLSATNLMNENYYRYSLYETLSETTYRYRIRPLNVLLSAQMRF